MLTAPLALVNNSVVQEERLDIRGFDFDRVDKKIGKKIKKTNGKQNRERAFFPYWPSYGTDGPSNNYIS